ncbi:hypothetical protein GCM10029992_38060 [Glycomyces albus]
MQVVDRLRGKNLGIDRKIAVLVGLDPLEIAHRSRILAPAGAGDQYMVGRWTLPNARRRKFRVDGDVLTTVSIGSSAVTGTGRVGASAVFVGA